MNGAAAGGGGSLRRCCPPNVGDSDAGIHGGGKPEAGTAPACAIRGGAALSPIALKFLRRPCGGAPLAASMEDQACA